MHILEAQLTNVRWAHAVSCGQHEHRVISSPGHVRPIHAVEHARDLVIAEDIAYAGLAVVPGGDHGGAQVDGQPAFGRRPPEKTPHAHRIVSAGGRCLRLELRKELLNLVRLDSRHGVNARSLEVLGKLGQLPHASADRPLRESTSAAEKHLVGADGRLEPRRQPSPHRSGDASANVSLLVHLKENARRCTDELEATHTPVGQPIGDVGLHLRSRDA